jgi:hypothetical protein
VRYRRKPLEVQAEPWRGHSDDHPAVSVPRLGPLADKTPCGACHADMRRHGWIQTRNGGVFVCPGDYIVIGHGGENYPCKPDVFEATYERAAEDAERS